MNSLHLLSPRLATMDRLVQVMLPLNCIGKIALQSFPITAKKFKLSKFAVPVSEFILQLVEALLGSPPFFDYLLRLKDGVAQTVEFILQFGDSLS